jgi:hypothetical protein
MSLLTEDRFLSVKSYPKEVEDRIPILAHFNAPPVLASKMCTEINGYFGSRSSYDEIDRLKSYSKLTLSTPKEVQGSKLTKQAHGCAAL